MPQADNTEETAAASAAGAQLAEILALALVEKGLIDREDISMELEQLANARQSEDPKDLIRGRLIQLANSIRAGKA